jgi:transmembrane sensor
MDASDRKQRAASEAADWFARLQAGQMERAEREQFVEWLRESQLHVAEMLRIAQIHGALERFQRWARIATGPKSDADNVVQLSHPAERASQALQDSHSGPQAPPSRTRRMGYGLRVYAIAATVLVVVATVLMLPLVRGQVIETERGERREVVLADGSVLQVDPETRLRVKYADTVRMIFLDRGRALFHVAKNPNRPFFVKAGDTTVRAVGTAFGVDHRAQGVVVTVAEGKVSVSSSAAALPSIPLQHVETEGAAQREAERLLPAQRERRGGQGASVAEADQVFLTANQQVVVQVGGSAEPVREVDSARALAWAEGRLIFQNDELGQAVAEFNRYNHVQLTVSDPALAAKPVSGVFNSSDPDAFIAFLQSVTPLEIVRDGDRSVTIASARHP